MKDGMVRRGRVERRKDGWAVGGKEGGRVCGNGGEHYEGINLLPLADL